MSQPLVLLLRTAATHQVRSGEHAERDQQKWSPVLRPIALFF
jgi:hypothetical protein